VELIVDGESGYLVPPRSSPALAARLLDLVGDSEGRRRMGAAARRRLESEFSLQRSVAETEAALVRLVGTPHRLELPLVLTVVLDLTWVGGVEVLLLNLFKNFDPSVVRPRLICLKEAGPLAAEFEAAGFEVEVLHRTGRFDLETLPRLVRNLRRSQTDVVLVPHHHRASLLLGRVAARLARVPVNVLAAHDMDLTSVGRRVLPRWAVATLRMSDALVLLTPAQGRYLHEEEQVGRGYFSTLREVVVPNGVELRNPPTEPDRAAARAELDVGPHDFVIGIVARLSRQKAHEVLFAATATLSRTHPDIRVLVIGGGPREQELRELSASLGIDGVTRFLGIRDDVERLLPGLDVSCLSSVHEGVPIAVIESMAAGLPVVATDCGSLRDLVTDSENGFLVPVGDHAALAERLRLLADDPELRKRLGAAGRLRCEREFQIEGTARNYERLFVELVARRRARGRAVPGGQE
jgi:glycosyltransferase involved in cell wall biosynthesis